MRRHAAWLRDWLARHPGWSLQIDGETARLRKTPADLDDATRPAREPNSALPFTRRRYVVLCLALAALERADRQTTLGRVVLNLQPATSGEVLFDGVNVLSADKEKMRRMRQRIAKDQK